MAARVPTLDFHAHFPVRADREPVREEYIARWGAAKWARVAGWLEEDQRAWRRAWGFPDPEPAGPDDEMARRWAEEVDRHRLVRVVFLTGGGNDRLAGIVGRYPEKFIGFAHHDPFRPDAASELERAVRRLGLRGYKVIAPVLAGRIDDECLYPVWDAAERFGIPHFGCGYPRELLHLAWVCGNVYVDTSGSNEWVRWMPYDLTVRGLFRKYLDTIGPGRIIFGTDSSWFPRVFAARYLEEQLQACWELGCTEAEVRAIFAGNAARLLGIAPPDRDGACASLP